MEVGKRKIIIIFVAVVSLFAAVTSVLLFSKREANIVSPALTPTPTEVLNFKTWKDQAQFSFDYPENITLNPHEEDKENYAHVELTSDSHPGRIIIWVKDTNAADIESWAKSEKAQNILDSTIGGLPAKKILIGEQTKKVTLSTINYGYLYQVESELIDFDFWNNIFDKITSSFSFLENEQGEQKSPEVDTQMEEEVIVEEEVIE